MTLLEGVPETVRQLRGKIIAFLIPYALNANLNIIIIYRGADKSLARPTSRYILFDGENIYFDASLVLYIYIYIYIYTWY